jgi:CBS domain containing-hemolysin-like protein
VFGDSTLWIACVSLVVTGLTAVTSKSLREFSRHELAEFCRRRRRDHLLGEILLWHDHVALGVECLQALANIVLIAAAANWVFARGDWSDSAPGTIAAAIAAAAVAGWLVVAAVQIWIPRAIVRLWAEPILFFTWRFWRGLVRPLFPLIWTARFVDTVFHRLAGREPDIPTEESIEDEIRTIVSEGHREGLLEEDAREMIEGVIELGDADVSEIMTPRTDMVSLHINQTWSEILIFVTKVGLTRIPVYDKNRDDIVGILYAKDLLPHLAMNHGGDDRPLAGLVRKPYFVPETKPVDALLQDFQRTRNHMAVVLDEYGGVSGLVTIEDVLEEIVGEIVDEYDQDHVEGIKSLGHGSFEALARVHIDEINAQMDVELPEDEEFDTIGGFVFHQLGRIPAKNEEVVWDNVRITVAEVSRRRIERVRIDVLDPSQRESA